MQLAEILALVALVVAIAGVVFTVITMRSLRAEVETSARRAVALTDQQARAADQAAGAAVMTAEAMQALVAEARRPRTVPGRLQATPTVPAQVSAHSADGPVTIESGQDRTYVLRNVSNQPLRGVSVTTEMPVDLTRNIPEDAILSPGQGHAFLLAPADDVTLPSDIAVTWEGLRSPVRLMLPPKQRASVD